MYFKTTTSEDPFLSSYAQPSLFITQCTQKTQCKKNIKSSKGHVPNWEELRHLSGYYPLRLCRTTGPCTLLYHCPRFPLYFRQSGFVTTPLTHINCDSAGPSQGSPPSLFLIQSVSSKSPWYPCSDSSMPSVLQWNPQPLSFLKNSEISRKK